jgi:GTP-binding protein EngB required for normal cell division
MFRWFAPLLLFAAKPEVMLRILGAAVAAAVLFFGVWLISNIAVTFDTLKNPTVAIIYGGVLVLFFSVVTAGAWLRLRRVRAPAAAALPQPARKLPPLTDEIISKRAKELVGRWDTESRDAEKSAVRVTATVAAPPSPAPPPRAPARATLVVTGPAYAGKSTLIKTLLGEKPAGSNGAANDAVRLKEEGSTDADARHLDALVASVKQSNGVVFVVDQDLRAPEVAAIKRFMATGKPLYLVLNKIDQFSTGDREAILASIRGKMPARFPAANIVCVSAAPMPVAREIEDARGAVRVEMRRPASDVAALLRLLGDTFAPRDPQALRFDSAQ